MIILFQPPGNVQNNVPFTAEVSFSGLDTDCRMKFETSDASCTISPEEIDVAAGTLDISPSLTANCANTGNRLLEMRAYLFVNDLEISLKTKDVIVSC